MRFFPVSTAVAVLLSGISTLSHAAKLEDVAPYPKAEDGFVRQVIHLPKQAKEEDFKVEVLAGKTLTVDCNRQRLGGTLEEKPGWLGLSLLPPGQGQRPDEHPDGLSRRHQQAGVRAGGRRRLRAALQQQAADRDLRPQGH